MKSFHDHNDNFIDNYNGGYCDGDGYDCDNDDDYDDDDGYEVSGATLLDFLVFVTIHEAVVMC